MLHILQHYKLTDLWHASITDLSILKNEIRDGSKEKCLQQGTVYKLQPYKHKM